MNLPGSVNPIVLATIAEARMKYNELPKYDMSDNPTGCCPRFEPDGWDAQELHFQDKPFVRATTRSLFHVPINMGSVFRNTFEAIESAGARDDDNFVVLSRDLNGISAEHLFAVTNDIADQEMVHVTGEFVTKVFEGPFKNLPKWHQEMHAFASKQGEEAARTYFFYTTCPKCAKFYGKNYVVGVARVN